MTIIRKFLFVILLIAVSVGFGVAFERDKFFPYFRITEFYERNYSKAKKFLGVEPVQSAKQAAVERQFEIVERKIPSALLPLKISGVQLNAKFRVAAPGGGIAVVNNKIVIADRLDQISIYDPKDGVAKAAGYPPLPSNRDAFYKWGKHGTSGLFRVHDIEFANIEGRTYLIVAHELFDTELKTTRLAVHRLQIDQADMSAIGNWQKIFTSTPLPLTKDYFANGAGGRLAADGDGVYLTIGDYNQDGVFISMSPPYPAQVKTSDFGSIFKLNIKTGVRENISYGHRNPQGIVITKNGDVFSTEHGPRGGDELNLIKAGRNYGWPEVTLGTDYPKYSWPFSRNQGRHEGFEAPVFSWVPSIGVSNLIEVQGFDDRWDGDLVVASLKAATLFRLRRQGGRIVYSEPIWIGQRVRDIAQLTDGTIVLWTDQTQLLFLKVDNEELSTNKFAGIPSVSISLTKCLECHHVGATNPSHAAPSLSNIVGRAVASDKNFTKYSDALKKVEGNWTVTKLTKFLTDPNSVAPGTSMAMEPMKDLRRVRKLIEELERAK